jgi:hypothetical protein
MEYKYIQLFYIFVRLLDVRSSTFASDQKALRSANRGAMREDMKMGLKQLLQEKREEILSIAAKHGAYNLRIFGSVARGEETEASDIDFLIDYDLEKISAWFPGGLILDLETLLNRKVDVVTTQSLHDLIRDKVFNEAVPL